MYSNRLPELKVILGIPMRAIASISSPFECYLVGPGFYGPNRIVNFYSTQPTTYARLVGITLIQVIFIWMVGFLVICHETRRRFVSPNTVSVQMNSRSTGLLNSLLNSSRVMLKIPNIRFSLIGGHPTFLVTARQLVRIFRSATSPQDNVGRQMKKLLNTEACLN